MTVLSLLRKEKWLTFVYCRPNALLHYVGRMLDAPVLPLVK